MLQGRSLEAVRIFLNRLGQHWVPVELNPGNIMKKEADGKRTNACLSFDLMHAFFQDRKNQVFEPSNIVADMSSATFCQAGAFMDWTSDARNPMIRWLGNSIEHSLRASRNFGLITRQIQPLSIGVYLRCSGTSGDRRLLFGTT